MMMKHATPEGPAEISAIDGIAYSLWLPPDGRPPLGSVIILHGAGSTKESHHDFARACRTAGLCAVAIDLRGHGASSGPLDDRVVDDVASVATVLPPGLPVALRGSSMGGTVALLAAGRVDARAVVAICPAPLDLLLRGLRNDAFAFASDKPRLEAFLAGASLESALDAWRGNVLFLHAEGDERVPVGASIALHERAGAGRSKLVVVPGGHHRSVQHDGELQGIAVRFIKRAFAA